MKRNRNVIATAIAALAAGLAIFVVSERSKESEPIELRSVKPVEKIEGAMLGLFTTLPIYWPESDGIGDLLTENAPPHWVRILLERRFDLVPLDSLNEMLDRKMALTHLMLAQPRALSGAENVQLDEWVRSGGRALIFADPMLTAHSRFALGDPRRPQDVALLSPILKRWGLQLLHDPNGPRRPQVMMGSMLSLPVDDEGSLQVVPTDAHSDCVISGQGVIAICSIGEGRATIVADAAILDDEQGEGAVQAFDKLTEMAFANPV